MTLPIYYTPYTCVDAQSCPSGTYANTTNFICASCIFPCSTCSSNTSCVTCVTNYNLQNNACVSGCTIGFVAINSNCVACTPNCSTCYATQSNCTSCIISNPLLYLINNICVIAQNCPIGTYPNSTLYICDNCISPCASCSNYSYCLTCIIGSSLYLGICSTNCPSGYYSYNQICTICSSPCSTCSNSATNCTSCLTNLVVQLYLSNNFCVQANGCPDGTYANSTFNNCSFCNSPCNNCANLSFCLSCVTGNYLYNGICSSSCPIGYLATNGLCSQCTSPCQTCSTALSICTKCLTNLIPNVYLTGSTCVIASACPYGTYANSTTNVCESCVSPCTACSSISYCLACIIGQNLYNGNCILNCPQGYYSQSQICAACISPCATCTISGIACDTCLSNLNPPLYLINQKCVLAENCPSGTYSNSTDSKCSNCVSPCLTCSNFSFCLSCIVGSNLYNGSCINSCPPGYYILNQICSLCLSPCLSCVNLATNCLSCVTGLNPMVYFINNQCVIGTLCPSGTYPNSTQGLCITCTNPCNTCVDNSFCLTCVNNYYLISNTCILSCPLEYLGINGVC